MLKRISLLIVSVLVLAILITGLAAIKVISSFNDQYNRNYLLTAARMIQMDIREGRTPSQASERTGQIYIDEGFVIRITVVSRQGDVLFDNEADQGQMENHLFRPEISYAFQNQAVGTAIRRSATLQEDMLYIALYDADQDIVIRTSLSLQFYRAGLNRILLTILLVLGGALVLLNLIGFIATRLITRPLLDLEKAALAMSAGDYQARVRQLHRSGSEIAALSQAFNAMAERLQIVVQDLEDKNERLDVIFNTMTDPLLVVSVSTAVTYLNRAAREAFGRDLDPAQAVFPLYLITHSLMIDQLVGKALAADKPVSAECPIRTDRGETTYHVTASAIRAAGSKGVILTFHDISAALRLQKMRSDFVANVTHELRTPLTSIRGFIETLRGGAINNPAVAGRFLEIIDIEAEGLHKLISDILILSEIENLQADPDRENFDLHALIDDAAVLLDEAAAGRKVSLIVEDNEEPLMVFASPYGIKQVLINLLDNAVKYNNEGGKVYVSARRQTDGQVCLEVRDTGPGIPAEHLDRIFERFFRVDTSRSRELGGTGLGLSIVKHIAQLYGGTVKVASRPGEGTVFRVLLNI